MRSATGTGASCFFESKLRCALEEFALEAQMEERLVTDQEAVGSTPSRCAILRLGLTTKPRGYWAKVKAAKLI